MTHVEDIVSETIGVLLAPYDLYDRFTYLCPRHPEDRVCMTIHSLVRMESCRVNRTGILSPCYPSKGYKECRNTPCPYIIGHSIYLWIGHKREALHKGETGGCGCTFKHSKQEIDEIRNRVYDMLDADYGMQSILGSSPLQAFMRVQLFHRDIIQRRLAQGADVEMTPSYNVQTMKVEGALLFKSGDDIFAELRSHNTEDEAEEEEETEEEDDTEKFPPIAEVYEIVTSPAATEVYRRKAPASRKDLPYQAVGI